MSGHIDIVCNLYDRESVRKGQTGIDNHFKKQVRMDRRMWGGVPVSDYLRKMDRAGIERSLLIAVRAGDLNVAGSFELPYARVHKVCNKYPDRFSGLAGVDPYRGVAGLRELSLPWSSWASLAHTCIRTGSVLPLTMPSTTRTTRAAPNWVCRS
ncbi:MAG: hypothetical protein R3E65_09195 [Steroidobacteraceae bacterium]